MGMTSLGPSRRDAPNAQVADDSLRRVHECHFGVLAVKSETVDPLPLGGSQTRFVAKAGGVQRRLGVSVRFLGAINDQSTRSACDKVFLTC